MTKKRSSLKNEFRTKLLKEVRARGHGSGNIWYVYSVKMDVDLVLPSDQALLYWVVYLEVDANVVEFSQGRESDDFDFFVHKKSGEVIRVVIGNARRRQEDSGEIVYVDSKELKKQGRLAVSIMKAIAFAAAIRGDSHVAASNSVRAVEVSLERGDIEAVLNNTPLLSNPIVCGLLVRHWIAGLIVLDFTSFGSFGRFTKWRCSS